MVKNSEKLRNIRHTLSHVLAYAVLNLYGKKVKFGIGPVIDTGFYYDFDFPEPISDKDLSKIEKEMKKLIKQNLEMKRVDMTYAEAKQLLKDGDQNYKLDLLKEIEAGERKTGKGQKRGMVSFYQLGEFIDLCKGGHVDSTKEINPDAFKLTHLAGAYWRGDEKNAQLTRIYAAAFATKKELNQHLKMLEEAKKRDHRKLGRELELFDFSDRVGPGLVLWTTKGTQIIETLEQFAKQTEREWGYEQISTPHIAKRELFETSGHLPYYEEDMYPGMELDDAIYYLKAMNCPITMELFGSSMHSYKDLPKRWAEYGTVYRYERSGVLAGLLRVRGFTQNDAHIFCREDQVEEEFIKVMKLHEYYYRDVFKIKDYYVRLSLRDKSKKDKFGGNEKIWKQAEETIRRAIKKSGVPYKEAIGEASFYGPKADFQIKSVTGREETASTNQIDYIMPERFGLKYTGKDGKEHPVVVIHRAPLGSHERFIGFLIEHFAGAFPVWLAPVQAVVLPISEEQNKYAEKIASRLRSTVAGLRVEIDGRDETISKKIREAEKQKIPYMLIVGKKEQRENTVSVRQRGEEDLGVMELDKFAERVKQEIENKSI